MKEEKCKRRAEQDVGVTAAGAREPFPMLLFITRGAQLSVRLNALM